MKNLLLTILIVIALCYLFGELSNHWFVLNWHHLDMTDPLIDFITLCVIAGVLILVGFFIAVSIVGALAIAFAAAFFGVLFVGLSIFWPILFLILIVYLVSGNKKAAH